MSSFLSLSASFSSFSNGKRQPSPSLAHWQNVSTSSANRTDALVARRRLVERAISIESYNCLINRGRKRRFICLICSTSMICFVCQKRHRGTRRNFSLHLPFAIQSISHQFVKRVQFIVRTQRLTTFISLRFRPSLFSCQLFCHLESFGIMFPSRSSLVFFLMGI